MKIDFKHWGVAVVLVVVGLIAAATVPTYILRNVHTDLQTTPSIVLPILIIAGVLGFLSVFAVMALAFAAVNLSDRSQALALPQGTVRSVIALSLIFIFLIAALYLYADLRIHGLGEIQTSTGISKEMVEVWDADEIVSIRSTQVTTDTTVYDVDRAVGQSEASEDFAAQILTTVSTLVVAIAGFYFGTRAVAVARGAVEQPKLRILRPDSPAPMPKEGEKLSIKIETTPEGEAVTWEIQGDEEGSLVQVKPDEFEYIRGSKPEDTVTLKFRLRKHPDVTEELNVEKSPEEST